MSAKTVKDYLNMDVFQVFLVANVSKSDNQINEKLNEGMMDLLDEEVTESNKEKFLNHLEKMVVAYDFEDIPYSIYFMMHQIALKMSSHFNQGIAMSLCGDIKKKLDEYELFLKFQKKGYFLMKILIATLTIACLLFSIYALFTFPIFNSIFSEEHISNFISIILALIAIFMFFVAGPIGAIGFFIVGYVVVSFIGELVPLTWIVRGLLALVILLLVYLVIQHIHSLNKKRKEYKRGSVNHYNVKIAATCVDYLLDRCNFMLDILNAPEAISFFERNPNKKNPEVIINEYKSSVRKMISYYMLASNEFEKMKKKIKK